MAHLWKHPNGTYYATWQESGRPRRKSLGTADPKKAKKELNRFRRVLLAGKVRPIRDTSSATLDTLTMEYLEYVESRVSDSTYHNYELALRRARQIWGNIPLAQLTPKHFDIFLTHMSRETTQTGRKLTNQTINKMYRHLKAPINKAAEWGYIKKIKFPALLATRQRIGFLTHDEFAALFAAIDNPEFFDFCELAAYTGLRSGEIIRLQAADIDNPKGFLKVSSEQKNKHESRIPINPNARKILDKYTKKTKVGKLFSFTRPSHISRLFKKYCEAAGITGHRFHDLRHSFGSYLRMGGTDLQTIQELMRHESIQSTMVYAHVTPKHLIQASNTLNYGPLPTPKPKQKKARP